MSSRSPDGKHTEPKGEETKYRRRTDESPVVEWSLGEKTRGGEKRVKVQLVGFSFLSVTSLIRNRSNLVGISYRKKSRVEFTTGSYTGNWVNDWGPGWDRHRNHHSSVLFRHLQICSLMNEYFPDTYTPLVGFVLLVSIGVMCCVLWSGLLCRSLTDGRCPLLDFPERSTGKEISLSGVGKTVPTPFPFSPWTPYKNPTLRRWSLVVS